MPECCRYVASDRLCHKFRSGFNVTITVKDSVIIFTILFATVNLPAP